MDYIELEQAMGDLSLILAKSTNKWLVLRQVKNKPNVTLLRKSVGFMSIIVLSTEDGQVG